MRCIYCLEDKPKDKFKKAEHVLPQSFGAFLNNLTLHKTVCDDCNQYFGESLELDLARDTFEGSARFQFGLKPASEYRTLGKRSRMQRKVAEGPFKGAHGVLRYSEEEDKVMLVPLPQVGFLNKDSEYEFFLVDNIPSKDVLESKGFELKHPNGILILPLSAQEEARTRLKERGIDMKVKEGTGFQPSQNEDLLCEVEGTTDQTILRAVAKICFNYLAYWERLSLSYMRDLI